MLGDFFRINLPYGLKRNDKGEWMAFNREYMPIGYNDELYKERWTKQDDLPIYTKYKKLTEAFLIKIAARDGESLKRDEKGKTIIGFYNDETNPMNQTSINNTYWKLYWEKLEMLSKLYTK